MDAQNQPPSDQPQQTRVTTEALTVPVFATPVVIQNRMPKGYPWGIPENFVPEGFNLGACCSCFTSFGEYGSIC